MSVRDTYLTSKIISNRILFQMYLTLNNIKQSNENQKEPGVSGAGHPHRQRRLPA